MNRIIFVILIIIQILASCILSYYIGQISKNSSIVSLYVAAILFVLSTIFTFVVYNCKCEKKDILSAPNVHNVIKEAIAKEMKVMTEKYSIVYNKDLNIHEPKTENEKELLTLFNFIIYYKKATNIDIKSIGQIIDILKSLNNNNLHT